MAAGTDRQVPNGMRHRFEYLIVKSVELAVRPLSLQTVRRLGESLGLAFYLVDRVHRRIALANLEVAFPARTPAERRAIAKAMFKHFGRLLLELLKYASLPGEDKLARVEWEGEERVRLAYAQGKGILFCTGHFGYWEQQALAHALKFEPMAVMARPLDNPKLHDLLERIRTSNGNPVLYRRGAVRKALRLLADGRGVGILIDQHMTSPDAIYVDFFGRPAATTSTLAALALRTGAPVVPLFAFPLPDGRYRMLYEHPVEPPAEDSADAVREFTQRCTDVLEMHVRRHPELWLWMHRRWRDAPGADASSARGMFPSAGDEPVDPVDQNAD
jgi:Kdo2-lipid IVA lauroyltransferase/acyltransferase